MKKFLLGSILALTTITSALGCWFTQLNFNRSYIAGVNNFITHVENPDNFDLVRYKNYQYVDLPITVWVKIAPRYIDENENVNDRRVDLIETAILEYRIKKAGSPTWKEWVTVKTLHNVTWSLNFQNKVALFGRNNINPSGIKLEKDDLIMIRFYIRTEDGYESGSINRDDQITLEIPTTNNGTLSFDNR